MSVHPQLAILAPDLIALRSRSLRSRIDFPDAPAAVSIGSSAVLKCTCTNDAMSVGGQADPMYW